MKDKATRESLRECGQRLLENALKYRDMANQVGIDGVVVWISGVDDELIIVTRGEYRDQLLSNIVDMKSTIYFGTTLEKGEGK